MRTIEQVRADIETANARWEARRIREATAARKALSEQRAKARKKRQALKEKVSTLRNEIARLRIVVPPTAAKLRAKHAAMRKALKRADPRQWRREKDADNKERNRKEDPKQPRTDTRLANLAKGYGLSLFEYNQLHDLQDWTCAICRTVIEALKTKKARTMHIDHCHITGQVRGLLCHYCNTGLGHFHDSPARLRQAADYIERTSYLGTLFRWNLLRATYGLRVGLADLRMTVPSLDAPVKKIAA